MSLRIHFVTRSNEDSALESCVGLCNVGLVVFLLQHALPYFCFLEESVEPVFREVLG